MSSACGLRATLVLLVSAALCQYVGKITSNRRRRRKCGYITSRCILIGIPKWRIMADQKQKQEQHEKKKKHSERENSKQKGGKCPIRSLLELAKSTPSYSPSELQHCCCNYCNTIRGAPKAKQQITPNG